MTPRKWICFVIPALGAGTLPACFTPASYAPSAVQPFLNRSLSSQSVSQYPPLTQYTSPSQYTTGMPYYRQPQRWPFPNYAPAPQYIPNDPYAGRFSQALASSIQTKGSADASGITLNSDGSFEAGGASLITPDQLELVSLASAHDHQDIALPPARDEIPQSQPVTTVAQIKPQQLPQCLTDESKLITALRCEIEHRPQDVRDALKEFEPQAQELLRSLMPLAVTASQGGLAKVEPQQVAMVVDQLENLLRSLRPLAPITLENFCFCHAIRKFGSVDAMEDHPSIRAGEMVDVYAEVRNVCCEAHHTERGNYRSHLVCTWKLHKPDGESVWDGPKQYDKLDETLAPQHDHYQHLSFQMPHVSPGPYVLELEVVDLPTGRRARQKLEFTIGPPIEVARGE